jgi:WD40 repeat protein
MPSSEDINSQRELLAAHRRTLAHLKKQLAIHGIAHAPPALLNGLDEARANIRRCKEILDSWNASYDEQDDEGLDNVRSFPVQAVCTLFASSNSQARFPKLAGNINNTFNFAGGHFAFHPDNKTIAVSHPSSPMPKIFVLPTGEMIESPEVNGSGFGILHVAYNFDGTLFARSELNGAVRVFQTASPHTAIDVFHAPGWRVARIIDAIAFSLNGRYLAAQHSGNYTGSIIKIWEVGSWQEVASISLSGYIHKFVSFYHRARIGIAYDKITFSKDEKAIIVSNSGGEILFLSVENAEVQSILPGHKSYVSAMALSPDGNVLASGGGDNLIRLWTIGTRTRSLSIHCDSKITALAFDPTGKLLVGGDSSGFVCVWEVETGQLRGVVDKQKSAITSVGFTNDGQYLASSDRGRSVSVWRIPIEETSTSD